MDAITFTASKQQALPMKRLLGAFCLAGCTAALLIVGVSPACGATLSRSVDVKGAPSAVWSMIGPFCAIADWHPAIGSCTTDGKARPTRTLVTKDGMATFVELQTARSDAKHRYSYTFESSPVPVTGYTSTIQVVGKSRGVSTVTWSSAYSPNPGKEKDARETLSGIYESGLAEIKAKLAR